MKFQTKWELALAMIDEARQWGPCGVGWCWRTPGTAEVTEISPGAGRRATFLMRWASLRPWECGASRPGGKKLKARGRGRPPSVFHYGEQRPCAVGEVAQKARGWKQSALARRQTKGWLASRFYACRRPALARIPRRPAAPPRRSGSWWNGQSGDKEPTKYFLCDLPENHPLRRLVRIVKSRWKIEQDYQQLKEELGLDHYEGRNWTGWHHHVTLVMLAHAFLTLEMLRSKKNFWVDPATDAP